MVFEILNKEHVMTRHQIEQQEKLFRSGLSDLDSGEIDRIEKFKNELRHFHPLLGHILLSKGVYLPELYCRIGAFESQSDTYCSSTEEMSLFFKCWPGIICDFPLALSIGLHIGNCQQCQAKMYHLHEEGLKTFNRINASWLDLQHHRRKTKRQIIHEAEKNFNREVLNKIFLMAQGKAPSFKTEAFLEATQRDSSSHLYELWQFIKFLEHFDNFILKENLEGILEDLYKTDVRHQLESPHTLLFSICKHCKTPGRYECLSANEIILTSSPLPRLPSDILIKNLLHLAKCPACQNGYLDCIDTPPYSKYSTSDIIDFLS